MCTANNCSLCTFLTGPVLLWERERERLTAGDGVCRVPLVRSIPCRAFLHTACTGLASLGVHGLDSSARLELVFVDRLPDALDPLVHVCLAVRREHMVAFEKEREREGRRRKGGGGGEVQWCISKFKHTNTPCHEPKHTTCMMGHGENTTQVYIIAYMHHKFTKK